MRHSILPFALLAGLAAGCQPDVPQIQQKPEPAPDPVDTDEAVPIQQPDIEVEPMVLTFGARPTECPSPPQTITIRNVGNRPLDISTLAVRGADNSVYTITSPIPTRIRAGQEATVDVVFEAAQVDVTYDLARVFIESNDPDESEVRVDLTGEGSVAFMAEDQFLQQQASGVDVLWVLDNSGSMSNAVNGLKNAMSTFVQSMVNLGLDYRLAITTTFEIDNNEDEDCFGSGACPPPPGADGYFVDSWIDGATLSQQQVVAEFTRQAELVADSVGVYVDADDEECFDASQKALTAPRINQSPNTGFLRSDATLAIAVLSDDDDYSNLSASGYTTWLTSMKADLDDVSFSGMVPNNSNYRSVITQTGGVFSPISQFDINPFLTFLSFVAAGLEITFELDELPLTGISPGQAFTVMVCDAQGMCEEAPFSSIEGWTYDATSNTVTMSGSWIPEPGESIVITYPIDSDCPT